MNRFFQTGRMQYVKLLIKILITVACFWYISEKIDWSLAWQSILGARWIWLLPAILLFIISKVISAARLNIYFKNAGMIIPRWQNIKLYWLGMFYNLFLPGAISGDAYKVILLSKHFSKSYKKTTTAILLDRVTGVLSLGFILAIYGHFVLDPIYAWLLTAAAIIVVPLLYIIIKKLFPIFLPGFWRTFFLGMIAQGFILLTIYCLLYAMDIQQGMTGYIFIFVIAAIASVLPISVGGGLGVREFVIIEAAKYAGLDQHSSLVLSLLFYLVTLVCSAAGLPYVFRHPLKSKINNEVDPKQSQS